MQLDIIVEINSLIRRVQTKGFDYQSKIGQGLKSLDPIFSEILKKRIPQQLSKLFPNDTYKVMGSIGQGRVTKCPWIAIMNHKETNTTQQGVYLVFLFSRDLKKVYLQLAQGVTNTGFNSIVKIREATRNILNLKNTYLKHFNEQLIDDVQYKESSIYANEWNFNNDNYCNELLNEFKHAYDIFMEHKDEIFQFMNNVKEPPLIIKTNKESKTKEDVTPSEPIQKIFFGTPGGGKSYKVKKLIEEEHNAKERHFRTTFHPDTDYASFVGSYKPVMKGNDITYEFIPQVFTLAYIAAWNDLKNEYFLNIEEINRGNCAQIFGDLFQLLDRNDKYESEYPIKADTDLYNYLQYGKNKNGAEILINKEGIKDGKLKLPSNLSIVATMNTSDQSLFPMDSAFKRRWDWEFVPSKKNEKDNYDITIGEKKYKWHTFLDHVNEKIKEVTDSEDKQMGSYFIKSNMDEDKFKSKVMFYLWSEVCKDEYKTPNNFFRYKDNENKEHEFTFNDLYKENSIAILQGFMKYLEEDYNNKSKQ